MATREVVEALATGEAEARGIEDEDGDSDVGEAKVYCLRKGCFNWRIGDRYRERHETMRNQGKAVPDQFCSKTRCVVRSWCSVSLQRRSPQPSPRASLLHPRVK